jgi:aryl-alcohol dehydrogenase-like predicted oxidoreductase
MTSGFATPEGTRRLTERFPDYKGFYRDAQGAAVSSLGIGTYLGALDGAADQGYREAVRAALRAGINFIDTSLNYRNQRSEQAVGEALRQALAAGETERDEFWICTKAGYLVPDAIPPGVLKPSDIAGNMHSMAPAFLADQVERSRENLGLETIDVFYLHNPETQLRFISPDEFHTRIRVAFECLENLAAAGKIRYYGTATWEGCRREEGALSLALLDEIASQAAGAAHRFRFVQMPLNLAMAEAYTRRNQQWQGRPAAVLEVAARVGITAVGSAALLQGKLTQGLPEQLARRLPGLATDAQRAIQFARSTPGITVSLTGMGRPEHVAENAGVAQIEPLDEAAYRVIFQA